MNTRSSKIVISLNILKYFKKEYLNQKKVKLAMETRKTVVKKAHIGSALPKHFPGTKLS